VVLSFCHKKKGQQPCFVKNKKTPLNEKKEKKEITKRLLLYKYQLHGFNE